MYGAQTAQFQFSMCKRFENDVEMYGAQTEELYKESKELFENDVEMYGAQTGLTGAHRSDSLRMM